LSQIFRVLVLVTMVTTTLYWVMPYIDYMWYPRDQLVLLDQGGMGASFPSSEIFYWLQLVLWLFVSLGLFFFINVARTAFVVLYVVTTILGFLYGIQVLTPIESFLANTTALADGAIIAIMFFTSVDGAFREAS